MQQQYGTLDQQARGFIHRHQPKTNKRNCCSLSPALITRFILRTAIPICLGLATGMLSEWSERKLDLHNNDALLEFSDFSSCAVTLITAYTINALLNYCWPANPYNDQAFFQSSAQSQHTNAQVMELEESCVTHHL